MNKAAVAPQSKTASVLASYNQILQRKCACGSKTVASGECLECAKKTNGLQRKLTIGASNDPLELEADHVADTIMRMPHPEIANYASVSMQPLSIQRASSVSEQVSWPAMWSRNLSDPLKPVWFDEHSTKSYVAQRRAARTDTMTGQSDVAIESAIGKLPQSGTAMSSNELQFFEPRFGSSFRDVRIHADAHADHLARAINAEAFTIGSHIGFRSKRYAPSTESGRRLLAHELTHVVQQTGNTPTVARQVQRTIGDGHDLVAPRFTGNVTLEAAFDDELLVRRGSNGDPVRLIQESLREMGYALPLSVSSSLPGRMDGIFGPETEAAVIQFQTDAGAVLIDGIVGPETMGLLDTHDVSLPTARPPATTGPVPAPLAAANCDARFAGVTFALANQVASGTATPADIRVGLLGGRSFLQMRGLRPITYHPDVTITAPTNAAAQEFRVGFSQTLLDSSRVANYSAGATVATIVPTLPIKDGAPTDYHPIYVTNPVPNIVEDFAVNGGTSTLTWPDVPGDGAFVNLSDNPSCAAALPAQNMTRMQMSDSFRIWVVVQHRPSGCVRTLHHVDWNLDWSANVAMTAGVPTVAVTSNVNNVTEPNGNGSPRFVQGGNVPGEIAFKRCT